MNLRTFAPGFKTTEFWIAAAFVVSDLVRSYMSDAPPIAGAAVGILYGLSRVWLKTRSADTLAQAEQVQATIKGLIKGDGSGPSLESILGDVFGKDNRKAIQAEPVKTDVSFGD